MLRSVWHNSEECDPSTLPVLAIDFGTSVGLSTDYSGKAIQGNPDAGIYEATSIVVEKPAPLVIGAVSGQIKCFGDHLLHQIYRVKILLKMRLFSLIKIV